MDDDSDDATPAITARLDSLYPHLTVLRNESGPPPGWIGKCWALHRGYGAVQPDAEWLCFTDADIHWDPQLLRLAMAYAIRHEAELVSGRADPAVRVGD